MHIHSYGFVVYFIRLVIDTSTSRTIIIHLNDKWTKMKEYKFDKKYKARSHTWNWRWCARVVDQYFRTTTIATKTQHLEEIYFIRFFFGTCYIFLSLFLQFCMYSVLCNFPFVLSFSWLHTQSVHVSLFRVNDISELYSNETQYKKKAPLIVTIQVI